jgi:hypothetical protein
MPKKHVRSTVCGKNCPKMNMLKITVKVFKLNQNFWIILEQILKIVIVRENDVFDKGGAASSEKKKKKNL